MRSSIEAGHFTAQHYIRMFSARISEHEAAGKPIFNPRSPWIKQTNGSRCFYYCDHNTHPSAYSLIQPDEGVKKTEPHRRNGMHETADAEFEKFFAMAQNFDERGIRDLPEAAPPQQPPALPAAPAVGGPSPRWVDGMVAECLLSLKGHAEDHSAGRYCAWVQSAAFSPDSASIVTASADKTARVWDVATGECQLTLDDHTDWVNTAAFSCGDGALIVTACDDRKSRVWDAKTGECRLTIPCRDYKMKSAAFSPDGATILTASGGNPFDYPEDEPYAQIWEVPSWKVGGGDATYPTEWQARVDTLCGRFPDADKNSVVAALLEHDGHAGRAASTLQFPNGVQTGATGFRNAFAAGRTPPDSGKSVKFTLKGHSLAVLSAAFSPSGAHAVTASDDETAKVWDMVSGRCQLTLNGHTSSVNTATFSSGDGAVIVTASDDGTAKIWDAKTGACRVSLKGHTEPVKSADLSQDGATVVTASDDMTARIWDAASGECLCTLNGHTGPLMFAAFSPDGGAIVTASQDTTAKVWAPRKV
jgi:WD40 repeat protein